MRTTTLMSAAATDADNNSTGDNANTSSWQHQHHLLPPRPTTHHHLPPLHHPPTRAYAYAHFREWLLFAMTTTMTTFHHPPLGLQHEAYEWLLFAMAHYHLPPPSNVSVCVRSFSRVVLNYFPVYY